MADKQLLHELLKEEQEPFHLNTYIADRCSYLKKSSLQISKRKPIIDSSPTKLNSSNLCKNACFFSSFQNSQDFRKSQFHRPCKSPNRAVFLHVPAKTAAILVEAAMRIQTKQVKRKSQIRSVGFGLFGSVFKRLKDRTKNRKRMVGVCDNDVKITKTFEKIEEKVEIDARISSSCDTWSSSNEEKSMDLNAWTSSCSAYSEEIEYVVKRRTNVINRDFGSCETRFCSGPFRFSLQKSASSSGHRTPELSSPAASPSCRRKMEKSNCATESSNEVQGGDEEDDKEHFSPVSILDPPFEESANVEEDEHDLECNYANVQRAKEQLLCRLRRFERLAELDPMEPERKLLDGPDEEEQEHIEEPEPFTTYKEHNFNAFGPEVFSKSSLQGRNIFLSIVEQKREMNCLNDNEQVFDGVDLMIKLAFVGELERWTSFKENEEEIVAEVEVAIFGVLVEELSDELLRN